MNANIHPSLSSIHERICIFDEPFAYICANNQASKYCSGCLQAPKDGKLYACGNCSFARYCNKDCQRIAWKFHNNECRRLKSCFPNLPLTEVLFLSRVIDRIVFINRNGDKYNWQKFRKFSGLVDHQEEIKNDQVKYEHFEKIYGKMKVFRKEEMIEKDEFIDIYCKIAINSHSIHTSAGIEIGMAIDLGVSMYDHSCRPNCTLIFDGYRVCLRPLIPNLDAKHYKKCFISYIDLGRSRYQRRKELLAKWYFKCECIRCCDPTEDILTSIRCTNRSCNNSLIITEDSPLRNIICESCKYEANIDYVEKCQKLMLNLPASFSPNANVNEIKRVLDNASEFLHQKNVYITRMEAALLHFHSQTSEKLQFLQEKVYENYKMCFPNMDRHIGFQLLNMVRTLIEGGMRIEATSYAYEAMSIFEVCFGIDHPFYLQTLALWTYLKNKESKTTEELLALMNFGSTKPIDIRKLIFE